MATSAAASSTAGTEHDARQHHAALLGGDLDVEALGPRVRGDGGADLRRQAEVTDLLSRLRRGLVPRVAGRRDQEVRVEFPGIVRWC